MRRTTVAWAIVVAITVAGAGGAVERSNGSPDTVTAVDPGGSTSNGRSWSESWGFEAREGLAPGHIDGQEAWTALSGSATEAHVDTANPHTGTQHLRISNDPALAVSVLTGGLSPYTPDPEADPSSVSVWVEIGSLTGASYSVTALAPSQGLTTATVVFDYPGDILVLDDIGSGSMLVDTMSDWTPGVYVQLVIDVDPVADTITYTYGGAQIYTSVGGVFGGTVIEQVQLASDNWQAGEHGDFDDLVIERGSAPLMWDLHRWSFSGDPSDPLGGADAVLHNGASVVGGALVLDGVDDYAVLPISATLGSLTDVSVEVWATWTGARSWERLFDFGNDTAVYWFMTPQSSHTGRPVVAITTGSYPLEQRTHAPDPFPLGIPTHLVYTLDGDGVSQQARLYVNGTHVATHSEVSPLDPAELGNLANIWLGRSPYPQDPYFAGAIHEFAICGGVLGDLDVLERYRAMFHDGFESGDTGRWSATHP